MQPGAGHAARHAQRARPESAARQRAALLHVPHRHLQLHRVSLTSARPRCSWARSAPDIAYHDREWGVPQRDDRRLFELLVLEGAQAGLSWSTILARRAGYRRAFAGFEIARVARFTPATVARLLRDPGIIRHRGKIESAIGNARAVLAIQREHGSFAAYLWGFVQGR